MNKEEILFEIREIIRDILDNPQLELKENTFIKDIEGWDSLSNVQIVVAIERKLGIHFMSKDIQSWHNLEEIINTVINKL